MLKQRRGNRIVSCLVCWTCHGRMGPNHFVLRDGGAVCGLCDTKNPLGNLQKMSIQEVTEPSEIIVCFTRGGEIAHALHYDGKTVLGPWVKFQSAETLEKARCDTWGPPRNRLKRTGMRCGKLGRGAVTCA
jgi:hypothetical protein